MDLHNLAIVPNTRSQDLKKLEDSFDVANKEQSQWQEQVLNLLETYEQLLHATKSTQDAKIKELKKLISGIAYQYNTLLKRMQLNIMKYSPMKDFQDIHNEGSALKLSWSGNDGQFSYKVHKPRKDSHVLMGKMFINGYINAINTLTWKRLRDQKRLRWFLFI